MAGYGLTTEGFNYEPFEVIKLAIETELLDKLGPIKLDDNSNFGQLVGIFTEREELLWQALEAVYNAMYPDTATGFSLDNVVSINGLTRLDATATTVICQLTGTNQTLIVKGSQVSAVGIDTLFSLNNDTLLTNESFIEMNISINQLSESSYTLTINNVNYSYIVSPDNTKDDVIDALASTINADDIGLTASNITGILNLKSDSLDTYFKAYISSDMSINNVTTNAVFTATDKGNIPVPSNAVTVIQTPVSGWLSVTNQDPGIAGRNLETDTQLRIRRALSFRLGGAGTPEAIRARVLNVPGVTAATVFENIEDTTSAEGLPPHSFEVLVQGGLDNEIADTIWKVKPAGIKPYGNVDEIIIDSTGRQQPISFSRPVSVPIYVSVSLTKTTDYPSNGDDLIKQSIATQINALGIGQDVIYQSLYQSIYKVQGISYAEVKISSDGSAYDDENITIASSEVATTDTTQVTVEEL